WSFSETPFRRNVLLGFVQRVRSLVLALQIELPLQGAMESGNSHAAHHGVRGRRCEKPQNSQHRPARFFCPGTGERSNRFLFPRARNLPSTRRQEKAALQHALRASSFRAAALRCLRIPGNHGQPTSPGAPMTRKRSFPHDPANGKPIRDLQQPGYYPGYSTLGQQKKWDKTTRNVVVKRVQSSTEIRFFQP